MISEMCILNLFKIIYFTISTRKVFEIGRTKDSLSVNTICFVETEKQGPANHFHQMDFSVLNLQDSFRSSAFSSGIFLQKVLMCIYFWSAFPRIQFSLTSSMKLAELLWNLWCLWHHRVPFRTTSQKVYPPRQCIYTSIQGLIQLLIEISEITVSKITLKLVSQSQIWND